MGIQDEMGATIMPPQVVGNEIEGPKTFWREEILRSRNAKYQGDQPCYLIIDNKVYDVKDFLPDHPGGSAILTRLGLDATGDYHVTDSRVTYLYYFVYMLLYAFNNFHPSSTHDLLGNFYVGDIALEDINSTKEGFTKEIREIRELFKKLNYFESSKLYYFLKLSSNLGICALSVGVLYILGNSILGVLISAALMALFWQQCGWLAHDILHHQLFDNRNYNNLLGCFVGSVCQGFDPGWWKDKHNTHHAAPNVHGQDPDINTHPILSWSEHALTDLFDPEFAKENSKILPQWLIHLMVNYQTLSYFPILSAARISWCIQSILFILPNSQANQPSHMPISKIQRISLVLHYIWFGSIIFFLIDNWFLRFTFIIATQAICGLLLALVFALNHFGMKILTEEESSKTDFFVEQVITGRDVIASNPANQWIVDWFCGGLDYQIEHHASTKEVFGTLGTISHVASKKY
ncbi:11583_t:CDS:2 [Diversispora eburnea]|uniref:11583_t:CDS:1 n=1 Tax=Diversispora eburnea TaxID=1213867 RepID=A0A9N9AKS6_9GLOM|nr:11583_t:CDS:2 [Diversispora eburnea]